MVELERDREAQQQRRLVEARQKQLDRADEIERAAQANARREAEERELRRKRAQQVRGRGGGA